MSAPYEFSAERFSRWVSYVLRHNPTRYGLEPDRNGYVDIEAFFAIARKRYPNADLEQLRHIIENVGVDRFEVSNNRLRARYGHSITVEPVSEPVLPPEILYHVADHEKIDRIFSHGLEPLARRMIHLSISISDAKSVAQRRTEKPILIRVKAKKAHEAGVSFYKEGGLFLSERIPPEFIEDISESILAD